MKSYAEREVFHEDALAALDVASALVDRVGDHWGSELRCHELARAVGRTLGLEIVDGKCHAVEHSWLLVHQGEETFVLDVYVPGRVPSVQLVHASHWALGLGYMPGERRDDIREDVVERLVEEMKEC